MEEKDLKIGYLVFTTEEHYGEYYESLGGRFSRRCEKKVYRIDDVEDLYLSSSFEPIPLTREFLEQIGWVDSDSLEYDVTIFSKSDKGFSFNRKIRYVHELQEILKPEITVVYEWENLLKSIYK